MDKCSQLNHLVGLDKYGRAFAPQAGVRPDRQVGLFFWLWIGQPAATGAYDAGALLEQENGRDILFHQDVPESPDGQQHFWGKPLWGYYDSADEWVIRRQIELLMLAGVDFIVFDTTNARTYPQVYEQVSRPAGTLPAPPFIPTLILWIPCGFCMRSCIGRVNSPPPGTSWTASR